MVKCSVVILNWNGKNLLKRFLSDVVFYSSSPECDVIVVDNGSTDGSVEWMKQNHAEVRIISFDKNHGFTGGYNRAIALIDSEYIILLNSDIEVKERWCEPLIELLDNHKHVAIAMPKILSQTAPDKFEYAGACGGFIDKYHFPFCRGRIMSNIEKDNGQYDTAQEIFWATGAAMIVRRELYLESNGLDDDFFAHMEEIDICWRLQNRGYKIMVEPKSKVFHVGGATLDYNSPRKLFLNFRNSLFMIHKNTLSRNYKIVLLRRMTIDGVLAIIYLLTLKLSSFISVIKAHKEYHKNKSILNEKRADNIKKSVQNIKLDNIYPKSIIVDFAFGKKIFSRLKFK